MSETKFTKGPWHIRVPRKGHRKCHSISDSNNNDTIAYIYYRRKPGERDSNIALLAAAPEMYEALKEMLSALKNVVNINYMSDSAFAFANDAMAKAEDALKKARGEE